jgi:hypothetical protein
MPLSEALVLYVPFPQAICLDKYLITVVNCMRSYLRSFYSRLSRTNDLMRHWRSLRVKKMRYAKVIVPEKTGSLRYHKNNVPRRHQALLNCTRVLLLSVIKTEQNESGYDT